MKLHWRDSYPVPTINTSLTLHEARMLRRLCCGAKVLEVGSANGYSTIAMALVAESVDAVDFHRHIQGSLETLNRNLLEYGVFDRVNIIVDDSKNVLPKLLDESYDFIFLDGDHSASGLESDIINALRLIRKGGYIAVHDYGEDTCPEVKPTVDRLLPYGPYHTITELHDTLYIYHNTYVQGEGYKLW